MFRICVRQLRNLVFSARFYVALVIGISMQFVSIMPLLSFSQAIEKPLCIWDSFIYFNCDDYTASTAFLGLILLVSDIPFSSSNETYDLLRTSRQKWMMGKVTYLACVSLLYYLVISISGMLYIGGSAFGGNVWSDPLRILTQDTSGVLSLDFGVYFPYRIVLSTLTPLHSYLLSLFLSAAYGFVCCLLLFWLNLILPRSLGFFLTIVSHIIGYTFSTIVVTSTLTKISLFGNSLLMYHTFDSSREKPFYLSTSQSFCLFGFVALGLFMLLSIYIRQYDFKITAGENR